MASTYADPDIRTTPAGTYRHPRQYARVIIGPWAPAPPPPGQQIRQWRRDHQLSLRDAARHLGIHPSRLSQMERDLVPVPRGTLTRLRRILTARQLLEQQQ